MRVLAALAVVAFAAGCLDASGSEAMPGSHGAASPLTAPTANQRHVSEGTFAAALGDIAQLEAANADRVVIPKNAVRVRIELNWSSHQDLTDLDYTFSPVQPGGDRLDGKLHRQLGRSDDGVFGNYDGSLNQPDSPSVVEVGAEDLQRFNVCPEEACPWLLYVFVDAGGAGIDWTATTEVWLPQDPHASVALPRPVAQGRAEGAANAWDAWTRALVAALAVAVVWWQRRAAARLLLFVPWVLFARKSRDELLDHPHRRLIVETLLREPGLNARELHQRLGGTYHNTVYHLSVLRGRGLVASLREGRSRRFVAEGTVSRHERAALAIARNPAAKRVLLTVVERHGSTLRSLADHANLAPSTVSWHLSRLSDAGLVSRSEEGAGLLFRPTALALAVLRRT